VDTRHEDLARAFGDLAIELQAKAASSDILQGIVDSAARLVPGARWAGISLVEAKSVVAKVPTSPRIAELDELQSQLNDGPCLTALRKHHTVRIDDMRDDPRWPTFAEAARRRGICSLLSFRLFVEGEGGTLGALNIFGDKPFAFTEESINVGEVLAQHAAVALMGAAAETQFKTALATRDIIGQAKGILMHWMGVTNLEAFSLLTRLSQDSNKKLADVARILVEQHESSVPSPESSPAQQSDQIAPASRGGPTLFGRGPG